MNNSSSNWQQSPQQGFYQAPTQAWQAGPPPMPPQKPKKPWYRTGCGITIIVLLALLVWGIGTSAMNAARQQQTAVTQATPHVVPTLPAVTQTPNPILLTPTDTPIPITILPTATPIPAHAPTPVPTAKPQPTSPPKPTPVPVLAIQFTSVSNGYIAVHTLSGAALTIKVLYHCSNHYATSQSLQGTSYADSGGNDAWSWTNQSSCHGLVTAYVNATSGGKTVSNAANFND